MKKLKLAVLSALSLIALVGCGGGETGNSTPATSSEESSSEAAKEYEVQLVTDTKYIVDGNYTSKKDLGDDYGMKGFQGCTLEWFEQVALLETALTNVDLSTVNPYSPGITGVTIYAGSLVNVAAEAVHYAGEQHMGPQAENANVVQTWGEGATAGNYSAGLGYTVSYDASKTQASVTVAYATFDGETVVDARFDVVQVSLQAAAEAVTVKANKPADVTTDKGVTASKLELGHNYNMVNYGGSLAEVDEEIEALADYAKGKTAAAFATEAAKVIYHGTIVEGNYVDENGGVISAAPEFYTVATITANDFAAALTKAYNSKTEAVAISQGARAGVGIVVDEVRDGELGINIAGCMALNDKAEQLLIDNVTIPVVAVEKTA